MAGRYNTWLRSKLADRIESNGGYYADRYSHYPLEWTVCFYESIDDADTAKVLLIEHEHIINETAFNLQFPTFKEWWEFDADDEDADDEDADEVVLGDLGERECPSSEDLHSWAQEALCEDLKNDEGLATWSPKTAARYGFDYKGPGSDIPFSITLENHGRGGKHVVVCEFEGRELTGLRAEELAEIVRGGAENDYVTNKWCRWLMGMMDEWDVMLTDENAKRCGLYYMTNSIARSMGLFD